MLCTNIITSTIGSSIGTRLRTHTEQHLFPVLKYWLLSCTHLFSSFLQRVIFKTNCIKSNHSSSEELLWQRWEKNTLVINQFVPTYCRCNTVFSTVSEAVNHHALFQWEWQNQNFFVLTLAQFNKISKKINQLK